MAGKFFVYDPEGDGFLDHFETEEEALEHAKNCIKDYLDSDGWAEEVEWVTVGKITHRARRCDVIKRPDKLDNENCAEDGTYWPENWDHMCNYKMSKV